MRAIYFVDYTDEPCNDEKVVMSSTQTKTLSIFAPAKINLYLHVTGRLDNGYHTLDSLIGFADIGDRVEITPSPDFQFEVDGPYARSFQPKELDSSPSSSNLVTQAAWALSRATQKVPNIYARLTKNLPLGSGLGGGSSDAAAIIWGLLEWWGLPKNMPYLNGLMARLGADIPVCLNCQSARIRGIGDILDPVPDIPEMPIVLVYPGRPCPTADVFMRYQGSFKEPVPLPETFGSIDRFATFLATVDNDLMEAACEIVPEINNVIQALETQKGCKIARMSGSGSSCFALFGNEADARNAAVTLADENPDWWVRSGWLGRPERY